MALKFLNDGYFAGKVGIGTLSPDTLLNLEGVKNTSIITLGSTTNDASWVVGDKIGGVDFYSADASGAGSGVKGSISYITASAGSGGVTAMTFNTSSSTTNNLERMRIDSSGNVGIGRSSSITARLFVEGPVDTATISTSSTPAARINNGGAISNWIGSNGYNYGLHTIYTG
jgi:hypothetical protein